MSVYSVDFHDLEDSEIDLVFGDWDVKSSRKLLSYIDKAETITCTEKGLLNFRRALLELSIEKTAKKGYLAKVRVAGSTDPSVESADDLYFNPVGKHLGSRLDLKQIIGLLCEQYKSMAPRNIVVIGALGGPLDQACMAIDHLYYYNDLKIFFIGQGILYCLLKGEFNEVRICHHICTRKCGLLPFRPIASISSQGLERNLDVKEMGFGNLEGSPNEVSRRTVELKLSDSIVWYSELLP